MDLNLGLWSFLPGSRQAVLRGELYCLMLCIRQASGSVVYVTDNETVNAGWHLRRWLHPSGPDADLWWQIGQILQQRGEAISCTVLFVHSHLEGEHIVKGVAPRNLVLGYIYADNFAAAGAAKGTLPESERARIHL
eukprot:6655652-Pyramimonas_sp.AAC.1